MNAATPRPIAPPVDPADIPQELKDRPQWVVWQWRRQPNGKWTKPPFSVHTGIKCDKTDPNSWCSYDEALKAHQAGRFDGIGFCFIGDGLAGIDLDDCRSPETGEISERARHIIRWVDSYTEVSPSQTGVKIYFRGKLPRGNRRDDHRGYEAYETGAYFCVTGQHVQETPLEIRECPDIANVYAFMFGEEHAHLPNNGRVDIDDRALALDALSGLGAHRAEGYHDWLGVGMALHSVDSSEAMCAEWDRFSQSSATKYTQGDCQQKWASFKKSGLGIGSLIRWAREDGWVPPWERNGHSGDEATGTKGRNKRRRKSHGGKIQLKLTDLGNAERLVAQFGDQLRFCWPWNKWLVWDGKHWSDDQVGTVFSYAKKTVRNIFREAATIDDRELRKAVVAHAFASEQAGRINAMIQQARSERDIPVLPADMDNDPWLFGCQNGVVNLKTGELLPHDKRRLITKLSPVSYISGAKCPLWDAFLSRIFDAKLPLIDFIQRLVGYSLTGDVSEQILAIFWGVGQNGKNTLITAITDILGADHSMWAHADFLMIKKTQGHSTEKMDLFGKRLVVASEPEAGCRLAESLVKQLTGGDIIRGRRCYEDSWEFKPTHKLILVTNHRPEVRGTDLAIWRRLRLVPFTVTIPESERDRHFGERLKPEYEGILAWAVRGCLDWQKQGLGEPGEVTTATRQYRAEEDRVGAFLAEYCFIAPEANVKARDLYAAYRKHAEEAREEVMTQTAFGTAMTERDFERYTSNGTRYRGVGLLAEGAGN